MQIEDAISEKDKDKLEGIQKEFIVSMNEILEIDLSKYSIDIYKDASSDNKYDGYIYAYIPPKFIKIINKDEL